MKWDVLPFCRPTMCYHFERFMLGCSWHYRKDVRRTRKIREKRGKAGESFEAIAVWVEMKKTRRVQSDRDSWREKVWQGIWNQTHHGGSNKEWLLALPVLGSCWIIQCCCPFTEAWVSLSALCPEQGGAATHIPALRASHPDKFTPSFPAGVQRSFFFPLLAIQWCFDRGCWVVKSTVTTTKSWFTGSPLIFLHIFSVIST